MPDSDQHAHGPKRHPDTNRPKAGTARRGTVLPGGTPPTAPEPAAEFPPELAALGKFESPKKLGEGSMGAVWRAHHTMLDKRVAIKVMNNAMLGNAEARDRFFTEMRAGGKLDHPNIVRVVDAGRVGDLLYMIMEYVDGQSLEKYVSRKGPMPAWLACELIAQAARGLQHAFEKGMAHRDIKPANLIVTRDVQVKVLDFGLVRLPTQEGEERVTQFAAFMGTADYVAPEQAKDGRSADTRADIYSLGCTLYFLLCGRPPFQGESYVELATSHVFDPPPPLTDLPPGLWEVLEKMLAKKRQRRYQTPAEVAEALAPFAAKGKQAESMQLSGTGPPVEVEENAEVKPAPLPRKLPLWVPVVGGLSASVLTTAILAAVLISGSTKPDPSMESQPTEPVARLDGKPDIAPKKEEIKEEAEKSKTAPPKVNTPPPTEKPKEEEMAKPKEEKPNPPPPPSGTVPTEKPLAVWQGLANQVRSMTMFPRSNAILAVQAAPSGTATGASFWNWRTRKQTGQFANWHQGDLIGVTAPPSGNVVASWGGTEDVSESWELLLSNPASGDVLRRSALGRSPGGHFAFTADGRTLFLVAGTEELRSWDVNTGKERPRRRPKDPYPKARNFAPRVTVSPSGRLVAVGLSDGTVRVWNADTGNTLATFRASAKGGTLFTSFSNDDNVLATQGADKTARVWNWPERRELLRANGGPTGFKSINLTPDGKQLLVVPGGENAIDLWDVATKKLVTKYVGHERPVEKLVVSPDGQTFASACGQPSVRVWALPK